MAESTFDPNILTWPRPKHGHVLDCIRPEAYALAEKYSHLISEFSLYVIKVGEDPNLIGIDAVLPEH
eukprot:4739555-Karenia_brevis.AAC.1